MSRKILLALLILTAPASAEVFVELIPDPPGPYVGGETVTMHVALHNEVEYDVQIYHLRFDFEDTDPQVSLPTTFSFDYMQLDHPHGYDTGTIQNGILVDGPPFLPVCFTENAWSIGCYPCPGLFYVIPPDSSYYVGSLALTLPTPRGNYSFDLLNADDPDWYRGALIWLQDAPVEPVPVWTAYAGEITGGHYTFVVSGPIPAASTWGIVVLAVTLSVAGTLLLRSRSWYTHVVASRAVISLTVVLVLNAFCMSSVGEIPTEIVAIEWDSGLVEAPSGGTAPILLAEKTIYIQDAIWLRLHFSTLQLSGSASTGTASFVRVTALSNADTQSIDTVQAAQWEETSGILLGDSVHVELFAFPGTGWNRIAIDAALAGRVGGPEANMLDVGVCGDNDQVLSYEPRTGRFRYPVLSSCATLSSCTTYLFNNNGNALLTNQHCCGAIDWNCLFPPVVEFNVPDDGNPAALEDQFPIDRNSTVHAFDWCLFGVFDNCDNQNPLRKQGASYTLARYTPVPHSHPLRVAGYPKQSEVPYVQRSATGPHVPVLTTDPSHALRHEVDIRNGNSGSAIAYTCGLVIGIHYDYGCPIRPNLGIRIDWPLIQDAITPMAIDNLWREPLGVAADCNANGIEDWCDVGCYYPYGNCPTPCGGFADCNKNLTPDECEPDTDWNNNSVQDICDIAAGNAPDCNFNFVIDGKDIADGFSQDADEDDIPDECEPENDCNANGREDICDIAIAENCDQNENAVPDDCEPLVYTRGACCIADEYSMDCVAGLTECTCQLRGGQFAGGHCYPLTCNIFGPQQ